MLKVDTVELEETLSPLHTVFSTALRNVSEISSLSIRIQSSEGKIAQGDCVATPAIMGDAYDDLKRSLNEVAIPELKAVREISVDDAKHFARNLPIPSSARAAVDCALWSFFNNSAPVRIKTDVTIPLCAVEDFKKMAEHRVQEGFTTLKIKVDQELMSRLEERIRISTQLSQKPLKVRLDPNQSWSFAFASEALTMLNKYKEVIDYVEQPLSRKDFEFNLMLRDVTDIPLMADESLMGEEDIDRIINQRAFEYVNIKIIKAGGLYPAEEMAKQLSHAGFKVSVGSMMESERGVRAAALLAHRVNSEAIHDLDAAWWLRDTQLKYVQGILHA